MTRDEWVRGYAGCLGQCQPTAAVIDDLTALAALAESSVDPLSAAVSCWLAGRSQVGLSTLSVPLNGRRRDESLG